MKNFLLFIGFQESFFILLIALILFGPKKIPELARILGEGIRSLRNATDQVKQEIWEASEKVDSEINESTKEIKNQLKETKQQIKKPSTGTIKRDD